MALTLRAARGTILTVAEGDANWLHCAPTSGTTQQNLDLKGNLATPNTWTGPNRGAYATLSATPVYGDAIDAFSLTPPALSHMNYQTQSTSLMLWREVVTGVPTDTETYAFSTYPTLGELVDAINAAGNWTAAAIAATTEILANTLGNNSPLPISAITIIQMNPAEIAISLGDSNNYEFTLVENTTLASPTNAVAGQSGVIHFTQHASVARTLAFDAFWGFGVGVTPTMTETLGGTAMMSYIVDPSGASATCAWVNKS